MLRMKRLLRTNPSDSSPALPKPARMRFGFGAWEQTLAFVEKNAYPFRLPPGNSSEFQVTGPFALKNRIFAPFNGQPEQNEQVFFPIVCDFDKFARNCYNDTRYLANPSKDGGAKLWRLSVFSYDRPTASYI